MQINGEISATIALLGGWGVVKGINDNNTSITLVGLSALSFIYAYQLTAGNRKFPWPLKGPLPPWVRSPNA